MVALAALRHLGFHRPGESHDFRPLGDGTLRLRLFTAVLASLASVASAQDKSPADSRLAPRNLLPAEARDTIALIHRGGPFPHRQDGSVFGNRESHLPRQPRGWYHEYTVDTPGLSHRGTRRIITGGNPPQVWYYTSDHYDSFRAFDPGTASGALQ